MNIFLLFIGLISGAAVALAILFLSRAGKKPLADTSLQPSDEELEENSEAVGAVCLAALGEEKELTEKEINKFDAEDLAAETEIEKNVQSEEAILAFEEKAAESGEVITDEEVTFELKEAEKESEAFTKAKKHGKKAVVPSLRFTLSRDDVLDYMDDMERFLREEGEQILTGVIYRKKPRNCDSLLFGKWCFALMYERSNVIKFTLRLGDETAKEIAAKYASFKPALFPKGEFWYDLIVDSSFVTKDEVYDILHNAIAFVFNKYYRKENDKYVTDVHAAKLENEQIQALTEENANTPDLAHEAAIYEYDEALKKYRQKNKLPFSMTRKRILLYAQRYLSYDGGAVVARPKRCLPASLRINGRTYALVYEKMYPAENAQGLGVKSYVSLTVRIFDAYAKWLALRHPGVCRAGFPKHRNWYIIPIDGSFKSAQMVYRVLERAKKFVSQFDDASKPMTILKHENSFSTLRAN